MALDIRDFVNVTITKRDVARKFDYNTVVYVSSGDTAGYYSADGTGTGTKANPKGKDGLSDSTTKAFAEQYFTNGGGYIHVVASVSYSGTIWKIGEDELPADEIVIVYPDLGLTTITTCGTGIQEKIIMTNGPTLSVGGKFTVDNIVQFGRFGNSAMLAIGAAAAYYTKIALELEDTVKQCTFTKVEGVTDANFATYRGNNLPAEFNKDTYVYIDYLAGAYRLLGGNDCKGTDVSNIWAKIVLTQMLTENLLVLLTSKIRLNSAGIASVKTCCTKVLKQFVTNGYIDTEKAWTGNDLYIDGELIAAENTPLVDGYKVHVGPITEENIKNHQIPAVYILYGDQVGVRKIVVNGEVF